MEDKTMSYPYHIAKQGLKFSQLTEGEQAYLSQEWERSINSPNVNSSEFILIHKANGFFFVASRMRINAIRGRGSDGGYWRVRYGSVKAWKFRKNPFGEFDPEITNKFYTGKRTESGDIIQVPAAVHTKKEAIDLARALGFEI